MKYQIPAFLILLAAISCAPENEETKSGEANENKADSTNTVNVVKPTLVSQPVIHDTDDPAIWINPENEMESLIIGTDKEDGGGLYVWNLDGQITDTVIGLQRPNNVDVAYGLMVNGKTTDIAVTTERITHKLRVYSLPGMKEIDGGGIPIFEGETGEEFRDLMGVALYTKPNGEIHAIVGRKNGPTDGTYLWQYALKAGADGVVKGELLRKFGNFSGGKEIEAIAVDDVLGYVYYSDELAGIRKYYADPEKGNEELAFFGTSGFADDREGICIYNLSDSTGYVIVSDQGQNAFRVFPREGSKNEAHSHPEIGVVYPSTESSDGCEVVSNSFGGKFPGGLFVAMSEDKTFHFYSWKDFAGDQFEVKK